MSDHIRAGEPRAVAAGEVSAIREAVRDLAVMARHYCSVTTRRVLDRLAEEGIAVDGYGMESDPADPYAGARDVERRYADRRCDGDERTREELLAAIRAHCGGETTVAVAESRPASPGWGLAIGVAAGVLLVMIGLMTFGGCFDAQPRPQRVIIFHRAPLVVGAHAVDEPGK